MSNQLPFFARFLETQELDAVCGGAPYHTMKYPSDGDDHLPESVAAASPTTDPLKDSVVVTLKYPSDGDDHLGNEA